MGADGIDYPVGAGLVLCVGGYFVGQHFGVSELGLRVLAVLGAVVGVAAWRASSLPNESNRWPWKRRNHDDR